MPAELELARREGVELIRTGRFQTLTGSWNPTPKDIRAAVEAMACPAIRKPVIRIGHTDQRFAPAGDGEPALGWFENLRATDGDHTLVADQVTLPWLHSVQAAAYPSRSIEGNYNHRCSEGHIHPFVIHTVALLGVTPPGVQTLRSLNDLPELLGVAASGEVPDGAKHVQVTILAASWDEGRHPRDGDGKFADKPGADGDALAGAARKDRDKLGVAGRIQLGDGERLVSSARLPSDTVSTRRAAAVVVDTPDGMTMRLGVLTASDSRSWDGASGDTAVLDEAGIGQLWDDTAAYSAVIKQRTDEYDTAVAEHKARVDGLFADAASYIAAIDVDARTPETMARYKQMEAEAYRVDRDEAPSPEWDGKIRTVTGPDGSELAYQLRSVEGPPSGTAAADGEYSSVEFLMDVAAKPAGRSGDWSLDTAIDGEEHVSFTAKQIQALPRTFDRLTVGEDDRDSIKAAFAERRDRLIARAVQAAAGTPAHVAASADTFPPGPNPIPDLPAAEPEPETPEPKEEDLVSDTDLSGLRSRLGLADDATQEQILDALDALKAKADTPTPPPAPVDPNPELVAASAAAAERTAELEKTVEKLGEQLGAISAELAAAKQEKADTVKASVLGEAKRLGKYAPADEQRWSDDYDEAPGVTTRILASIAPGTAVPVQAAGMTGPAEPETRDHDDLGVSESSLADWAKQLGFDPKELNV